MISFAESRPTVVVLDQLNCLASLADVFDLSLLEKNENWYVLDTCVTLTVGTLRTYCGDVIEHVF